MKGSTKLDLLKNLVAIAVGARDAWWAAHLASAAASAAAAAAAAASAAASAASEAEPATGGASERRRPLVAVSVGPYGASLADGSEFTGLYLKVSLNEPLRVTKCKQAA